MGDPRLLEDSGERGSALVSDLVVPETANKGRSEDGGRVSVSTGVDRKASTRGGGALERGRGAPLERLAELGDALGSVGAFAPGFDAADTVVGQAAKDMPRKGGLSMGADAEANTRGQRRTSAP